MERRCGFPGAQRVFPAFTPGEPFLTISQDSKIEFPKDRHAEEHRHTWQSTEGSLGFPCALTGTWGPWNSWGLPRVRRATYLRGTVPKGGVPDTVKSEDLAVRENAKSPHTLAGGGRVAAPST